MKSMINWQKMPPVFDALSHDNYRLFWFGQLISLVGIWMMMMATSWLVYEITGSKFLLGIINTISGLPSLFINPIGGVFADRMNKRNLLLFTQISSAILSFAIGLLVSLHIIAFWNLALLVFIFGLLTAIDSPVRQAFVVELIERRSLGNAIALNSLAFNSARIIGPAIAGYLIGLVGVESCYYLNAISFVGVIGSLLFIKGDFSPKAKGDFSVSKDFKEGLKYLFDNKKVLASLILVAITSIFIMPYAILMPVFAKDILMKGPEGMGLLMASSGIGALLGSLLLAQFSGSIDYKRVIVFSTFLMSSSMIVFSLSTVFSLSCLALLMGGWGIVSQAASVNIVIQQEVPNKLRGRIMGFYTMSFMGFMPIGAFQAGIMSHFIGAPLTLCIGAVISAVPALILILVYGKKY